MSYQSTWILVARESSAHPMRLFRGVEAVVVSSEGSGHVPTTAIALSLIAGFTFMLVVERQFSSHGDSHMPLPTSDAQHSRQTDVSSVEFDVELGELEREEGFDQGQQPPSRLPSHSGLEPHETRQRAYPLTLGLVVHALADGLALGSAALSESSGADASVGESIIPSGLSIVVFLALIIHKGVCCAYAALPPFLNDECWQ